MFSAKRNYIPRPATLTLHISGVRVFQLKLENSQARILKRALDKIRPATGVQSDADVADFLLALVQHELATHYPQQED